MTFIKVKEFIYQVISPVAEALGMSNKAFILYNINRPEKIQDIRHHVIHYIIFYCFIEMDAEFVIPDSSCNPSCYGYNTQSEVCSSIAVLLGPPVPSKSSNTSKRHPSGNPV